MVLTPEERAKLLDRRFPGNDKRRGQHWLYWPKRRLERRAWEPQPLAEELDNTGGYNITVVVNRPIIDFFNNYSGEIITYQARPFMIITAWPYDASLFDEPITAEGELVTMNIVPVLRSEK